jgi:hypothetical protein
MLLFRVRTNGKEGIFPNGGHVGLIRGDLFQIVDVISGSVDPGTLTVNFKGYVGNERVNTGEDRGYVIDTAEDLWPRYSLRRDGKTYPVVVSQEKRKVGRLYVDIAEPELKYIVVRQEGGPLVCLPPDGGAYLSPDVPLLLVDVRTNLPDGAAVRAYLTRGGADRQPFPLNRPIRIREQLAGADRIDLFHNQMIIGSIALADAPSAAGQHPPDPTQARAGQHPDAIVRTGDEP